VWIPAWLWQATIARNEISTAEDRIIAMAAEKAVLFREIESLVGQGDWIEARSLNDGSQLRVDAQFDGILYVFSTGCRFSSANIPVLHRLLDAGTNVVGIAVDGDDQHVIEWNHSNGVRFPVVVDAIGPLSVLLESGSPYTVVVSNGRLGFGVLGILPDDEVRRLLGAADVPTDMEP
jgi:hypothetical protein